MGSLLVEAFASDLFFIQESTHGWLMVMVGERQAHGWLSCTPIAIKVQLCLRTAEHSWHDSEVNSWSCTQLKFESWNLDFWKVRCSVRCSQTMGFRASAMSGRGRSGVATQDFWNSIPGFDLVLYDLVHNGKPTVITDTTIGAQDQPGQILSNGDWWLSNGLSDSQILNTNISMNRIYH